MASVSLTIEEFNSLKEREKELEELKKEFNLKIKENKQSFENEIEKNKLSYDKQLSEIEKDKSKILIEVKTIGISDIPDVLFDEMFGEIRDSSGECRTESSGVVYDEFKKLSIVKNDEEIIRKVYMNFDEISHIIKEDIEKTLSKKYSDRISFLEKQLESEGIQHKKDIDRISFLESGFNQKNYELEEIKEKAKKLEESSKKSEIIIDKKLSEIKSLNTELIDFKDLKYRYDILNSEHIKLETKYSNTLEELQSLRKINGCLNENLDKKNKEISDLIDSKNKSLEEIKEREQELAKKYNIFENNRFIVVKDYDGLSSISKFLLNKIYKSNSILEFNFNSKINKNVESNKDFINKLSNEHILKQ